MAGAGSRAWAKRLSAGKNIVISLTYRDIGFRVNYSLWPLQRLRPAAGLRLQACWVGDRPFPSGRVGRARLCGGGLSDRHRHGRHGAPVVRRRPVARDLPKSFDDFEPAPVPNWE
jgi:hypothetical protein